MEDYLIPDSADTHRNNTPITDFDKRYEEYELNMCTNLVLQTFIDTDRGREGSDSHHIHARNSKIAQRILDKRKEQEGKEEQKELKSKAIIEKVRNKSHDRLWQVLIGLLLILIAFWLGRITA